jgi:hypothetical protein
MGGPDGFDRLWIEENSRPKSALAGLANDRLTTPSR